MAVGLAGTGGDVDVEQSSLSNSSYAYTIPSDAEGVVVCVIGYSFDRLLGELNFDNGTTIDFQLVVGADYQGSGADPAAAIYLMTSGDATNWPGIGAKTIYWQENDDSIPSEGFTFVTFSVKGIDTTNSTSAIGQTGSTSATSISLSDSSADRMAIAALYRYSGTGVGELDTNSQTELSSGAAFNGAGYAVAYKMNASTMQNLDSGDNDSCAFTLLEGAGGSIIPQIMHHRRLMEIS